MASAEEGEAIQAPGILETIHLEHVPSTHTVHVGLFKDVTNADFLQKQLLSRNSEFEYAFIDATSMSGNMKTPNVHSEIVCSLSPNNNISEAYRRFGITGTTNSLIIIKVLITPPSTLTPASIQQHLLTHVQGTPTLLTDEVLQSSLTDWAKVRKYYKLNGVNWLDSVKDEAAKRGEMEVLVLEGMALRGL
ncbi:hypothetical protein ABKA04_008490 [Annulohypoxylon sp. FPYF3050]